MTAIAGELSESAARHLTNAVAIRIAIEKSFTHAADCAVAFILGGGDNLPEGLAQVLWHITQNWGYKPCDLSWERKLRC